MASRWGEVAQAKKHLSEMDHLCEISNWYAIYTRSRFEKKLHNALCRSGLRAFLPLVKVRKKWSDRIKTIQVPLLPSYVFIHTPLAGLRSVHFFPGFVRIVSFCGQPSVIPEEEIDLLRHLAEHGRSARPSTYCEVGDRVKISNGPFQGWEGRVESRKGQSRVVFQFEGLQQAISVEVGQGDLERIGAKN